MKIEFDLELIEVDDGYWSTTISDIIKDEVQSEVRKSIRKQIKTELKKSEKEIQKYVAELTSIKVKKALKEIDLK